jgi:hypothetical protein
MVPVLQFIALQNSRVIVSRTTTFSSRQSLLAIKQGLPDRFIVVVPSRFHFTITSPATDMGNFRGFAVSLTFLTDVTTNN